MQRSASTSSDQVPTARRRSGRVVRAPEKYTPPTTTGAAKRKHDDDEDSDKDVVTRPHKPQRVRKPASKKPRMNGAQSTAVTRIPSRPKKAVAIDAGEKGTGLFADVFGSGDAAGTVAQRWLQSYREDEATAMSNLINCILQCAGCHFEVTVDDVGDPDNIPNRLVELQTMYQEQQITEYPLISKSRSTRSFRDSLVSFFHSLVALLHETDVLYKDADLLDNVHAWLASMSSSALRPFRHTATTIALAVQTGLVDTAGILDRRIATIEQQSQAVKRTKNKSKAAEIQRSLTEANGYRKMCSEAIQSFFDTVFVHRYRDVDAKMRTECVEALGSWIWQLPNMFMEPGYLRYLGWMLSDASAATRHEVLKQLLRVFRRDAQQLGHFIDRFRPRLVEIATMDVEVWVRVAAIAVIDSLRAAALLEPQDIDAIGKLIFDSEVRIRKAVANFFVACIHDAHEGKVEDMGGSDVLDELDEGQPDDFGSPRKEWIMLKCLAETLATYDGQIGGRQVGGEVGGQDAGTGNAIDTAADLAETAVSDTRISLAAQVLYDKVPEVKRWELLAGYLLFDHTTSTRTQNRADDASASPEMVLKRTVAPSGAEESMLLEVLGAAVKLSVGQASEQDKSRRKGARIEAAETSEETALELMTVMPKLLSKFGAEAHTAAIVLRLERSLNLDVFQQLRQDSRKYEGLLDEISTQMTRHSDARVLTEAARALIHARQHEELQELVDGRLSLLWENSVNVLANFAGAHDLAVRGNLALASLGELSTTVARMSKLAAICDCVDTLEAVDALAPAPAADAAPEEAPEAAAASRRSSSSGGHVPTTPAPRSSSSSDVPAPIDMLAHIVRRGMYQPHGDDIDDGEDELVAHAIKACQLYFMWKTLALKRLLEAGCTLPDAELDRLKTRRRLYRRHLIETFSSRALNDEVRLLATCAMCDLHLTFATLRSAIHHLKPAEKPTRPRPNASSTAADKMKELVVDMEAGLVPELISIFDGAEKHYARLAHKHKALNEPGDDEDPVSDGGEDDDDYNSNARADGGDTDDDALAHLTAEERLAAELRAEKALCTLAAKYVMALMAGLVDNWAKQADKLQRRLVRNRAKLGNNFKEVVAFLDTGSVPPAGKRGKKSAASTAKPAAPQEEEVVVEDEDENEEEQEQQQEEAEQQQLDDPFEDVQPAEGSVEDLRRRELLDDDDDPDVMIDDAASRLSTPPADDDELDVLGD